jgi:hypothetical protein
MLPVPRFLPPRSIPLPPLPLILFIAFPLSVLLEFDSSFLIFCLERFVSLEAKIPLPRALGARPYDLPALGLPLCLLRFPYRCITGGPGLFAGLLEVRARLRTARAGGWRILMQP